MEKRDREIFLMRLAIKKGNIVWTFLVCANRLLVPRDLLVNNRLFNAFAAANVHARTRNVRET